MSSISLSRLSRNQRARLAAAIEPLEQRVLLSAAVVNTIADVTDPAGSTTVSLRDAVNIANNSATVTTITFSPTVFATAKTIILNGNALELSGKQPTIISGPAARVTINGNGNSADLVVDKGVTAAAYRVTFTGGNNNIGSGGAINNSGDLTLDAVDVTGNADNGLYELGDSIGNGGGIFNGGTLSLVSVTVSDNTTQGNGGGIENAGVMTASSVTISGNSGVGHDADEPLSQGGGIDNTGAMTLNFTYITGNNGGGDAGGIVNESGAKMTLANTAVSQNTAVSSGGIDNLGTATVTSSTISGNPAGIFGDPGGTAPGAAGGIFNGGTMTLIDCTVAGNSSYELGAGIDNAGKLTVADSTIADNVATSIPQGGFYDQTPSPGDGGGLYATASSSTVIENSIIAGNQAVGGKGADVSGAIQSKGFNLIGQTDGSTGWKSTDLTGTTAHPLNADLAPLANSGGPTQTLLLLSGSPAIGAGSVALIPAGTTTDQRGLARVVNGKVDIGAVELQAGAAISGTVFDDANSDGSQDSGEPGLGGVQVYLDLGNVGYYVNGDPTTTTNAAGGYTLSGLAAGNYIVRQVPPAGASQTLPNGSLGHHVTVSTGQALVGENFGDKGTSAPAAAITGTVFNDANGDGAQDNGESGLTGVQVYLDLGNVGYYVNGDPTTMTTSAGNYALTGLAEGNYIVRQVAPAGDAQTFPSGALGHHVTVSTGQTLSGQNFGDKGTSAPAAVITGTVFNDANGDGARDNGESGLAAVQVYLDLGNVGYYVNGDPTTMTNAAGGYTLSGLAAGSYIVRQVAPAGDTQTLPNGGLGRHVTVSTGQTLSGQNFGDKGTSAPAAVITGTVFNDANGDGTQDNGETGIKNVEVYLDLGNVGYFVNGDPTTMTNAAGGYTLSGLAAGNYIVRQVPPTGYVQTTPANGYGRHVTVAAGQTLTGQGFGDKA